MKKFKGIFPVAITPFHQDGNLDFESFRKLLKYFIEARVHGVVYPANASEFYTLSYQERMEAIETVINFINGEIPVIINATSTCVELALSYAKKAEEMGADGILLMAPYVGDATNSKIKDYFYKIGEKINIPIILQNAAEPSGSALSTSLIVKIVDSVPAIKYVKEEGTPSGHRISGLQNKVNNELNGVFGGDGGRSIINELYRGSVGTMPASGSVEIFVDIFNEFQNNNYTKARKSFNEILPLLNLQRVFKWTLTKRILKWRNIINSDYVRAPGYQKMDKIDEDELKKILTSIKKDLIEY